MILLSTLILLPLIITTFSLLLSIGQVRSATIPTTTKSSMKISAAHEDKQRESTGHFFDRYADCVQCFDKDDLTLCHQIVFSCPFNLKANTLLIGGLHEGDMKTIEQDYKEHKNQFQVSFDELEKSEERMTKDLYCYGMFSMFVKEREQDCKLDIGSSKDIVVAGLSYALRKHIRTVLNTRSLITCQGWSFANKQNEVIKTIGPFGTIRSTNTNVKKMESMKDISESVHSPFDEKVDSATIVFSHFQSAGITVAALHHIVLGFMDKHSWGEYLSMDENSVQTKLINSDRVEIKVTFPQ